MVLFQYVFDGVEKEVKVKLYGNVKISKLYYCMLELIKNWLEEFVIKYLLKEVFYKSFEESGGILQLIFVVGYVCNVRQLINIK